MTQRNNAGPDFGVVSPDRVRNTVVAMIGAARASGWTIESIASASGVKRDTIKGWLADGKEPSLSKALSVAVVLGERAVNTVLAIIGYGGATPLDEPDTPDLHQLVAAGLGDFHVIAAAAADGRIDHTEEAPVQEAADHLIASLLPLSSARRAE